MKRKIIANIAIKNAYFLNIKEYLVFLASIYSLWESSFIVLLNLVVAKLINYIHSNKLSLSTKRFKFSFII